MVADDLISNAVADDIFSNTVAEDFTSKTVIADLTTNAVADMAMFPLGKDVTNKTHSWLVLWTHSQHYGPIPRQASRLRLGFRMECCMNRVAEKCHQTDNLKSSMTSFSDKRQ